MKRCSDDRDLLTDDQIEDCVQDNLAMLRESDQWFEFDDGNNDTGDRNHRAYRMRPAPARAAVPASRRHR